MHDLSTLKAGAIIGAAAVTGEVASWLSEAKQHPALISAIVGGIVALAAKLADVWWESKKERARTADKVLEIEVTEKHELRERMNKLREEERKFSDDRLLISQTEAIEARLRAHRAVNEVMRLQAITMKLQQELAKLNVPLPEISFVGYDELIFGTIPEQEKTVRQIHEMQERIIKHAARESETETSD